ncbi:MULTISPECIES: hypothetical protein [Methylomonas]|uniref:Uncharacterized protein n=2 Tax=Methylomonas TaxID=416 RepID=A0A126T566_9GAMM|nr:MULTISPECIES: hypothetical protein [Methylomonas]AMK77218.1 hypothetical protein JT25_012105 [Methylomonas denitrificans]OAI05932.1 hypothetical protein A1342_16450 [Methylomonas methanica]TCV78991.1 hypothetical protein EDE11_12358 [Methylomonas methanica]
MTLKGIASAFATVLLIAGIGVGIGMLRSYFGWSNNTVSWLFFGAGTLVALALTYKLRHLAFINATPIAKDKPLKLKPLHYVGLITIAVGITLSMANITGVFLIFPFADKFILVGGVLIYIFTPPANGQLFQQRAQPLNVPATFKILAIFGAVVLFLAIIGCIIDIALSTILPSEFGMSIGIGFGAFLALGLVILSEKTRKRIVTHNQPTKPFQKMLQITWIRIPVNLMIGAYIGVGGFTLGMSYVYTHLFGIDAIRVLKVSGWHYGSAKACAKPEIEGRPFLIGEKALCVPKDARLSMPIGTDLNVGGRESALGFNVDKILSYKPGSGPTPNSKSLN